MLDFSELNMLVVGDVMLDEYVTGRVDRISPEAPVPILVRGFRKWRAGGAANVAVNLAALGCKVTLIGVVGPDDARRALSERLGVWDRLEYLQIVGNRPTTVKTRYQSGTHLLLRVDHEDTAPISELTEKMVIERIKGASNYLFGVIVSDYHKGVITTKTFAEILDKNARTFVDPKRDDFLFYQGCDWITPNAKELAKAINWQTDLDSQIRETRIATDASVLATLGPLGMAYYEGGDDPPVYMHALNKEPVDVTGAGDTVMAVFAACICAGMSAHDAAMRASQAAAIVVGKRGTDYVTIDELRAHE